MQRCTRVRGRSSKQLTRFSYFNVFNDECMNERGKTSLCDGLGFLTIKMPGRVELLPERGFLEGKWSVNNSPLKPCRIATRQGSANSARFCQPTRVAGQTLLALAAWAKLLQREEVEFEFALEFEFDREGPGVS